MTMTRHIQTCVASLSALSPAPRHRIRIFGSSTTLGNGRNRRWTSIRRTRDRRPNAPNIPISLRRTRPRHPRRPRRGLRCTTLTGPTYRLRGHPRPRHQIRNRRSHTSSSSPGSPYRARPYRSNSSSRWEQARSVACGSRAIRTASLTPWNWCASLPWREARVFADVARALSTGRGLRAERRRTSPPPRRWLSYLRRMRVLRRHWGASAAGWLR